MATGHGAPHEQPAGGATAASRSMFPLSDRALLTPPFVAQWGALTLEHHRQPPGECSLRLPQHAMCVPLISSPTERRGPDARLQLGSAQAEVCSVYPAGSSQWVRWLAPMEFLLLTLTPTALVSSMAPTVTRAELRAPDVDAHDPLLYQMAVALARELEQGADTASPLYVEALSVALAAHLIHTYATVAPADSPVRGLAPAALRQVIARIQDDLRHAPTQQEMAALAAMSPYHFARAFRAATGLAPHHYVTSVRIERGKELLRAGQLSMADIAARLGFADQSHFARAFKQATGMTPTLYRRAWRAESTKRQNARMDVQDGESWLTVR